LAYIETNVCYCQVGDGDIFATVYIGEGQIGGWAMRYSDEVYKGSSPERIRIGFGHDVEVVTWL